LINLIAEVDDILKLHTDQSKNTVSTGTDMDINSNKKVLGTIRIDPSVPSLSIWSRAATARTFVNVLQHFRDFGCFEMNKLDLGRQLEDRILVAEEGILHKTENQPRISSFSISTFAF
jgi:hypothetical protein